MFKSLRARIIIIVLVILASGTYLYRNYAATGSPVKLGLDLQGGMYLALEVDDPEGTLTAEARADAIDRAETVIRNRIDELGVEEPLIQQAGGDRLIVELAGVDDEERAKEIVGQTALLEWKLVRSTAEVTSSVLDRIDQIVVTTLGEDSIRSLGRELTGSEAAAGGSVEDVFFNRGVLTSSDSVTPDSAVAAGDSAAAQGDTAGITPADSVAAPAVAEATPATDLRPFTSLLLSSGQAGEFLVATEDVALAQTFLAIPEVRTVIPRDLSLQWGWEPVASGARTFQPLYVLEERAFLTGDMLQDAVASRDTQFNYPIVSFVLSRVGGRRFGDLTRQNIGERIAIVLDGQVVSAPVVQAAIQSRGQIELGGSTMEEASDLALVLRAGALPAPLRIEEERTVGASLGQDSIDQGVLAGIVGTLLVMVVMIGYYRVAGLLAVIALSVYVILVLGGLAALNATLTLPGIAGLVLSIGMSVDANVLIFERIREEIDEGRPLRTAVDEGFAQALSAIVDSNITTLITALILYQLGTGPVQGFGVTLAVGIICSFFSAVYVTRTLFLIYIRNKGVADPISI